jgi:hypothetical protein
MTTGFGHQLIAAILLRDGAICGMYGTNPNCRRHATTANHRLNRGAGGSKLRNGMSNGCAICDICNNAIEDDAELAEIARHRGVKLTEGDNPSLVPMWSTFFLMWVILHDDEMLLTGLTDETVRPDQLEVIE